MTAPNLDFPCSAPQLIPAGVVHLDPAPAVFEAMIEGWARQQRVRFLQSDTIDGRVDVVRRLAMFSNQYPWQWRAAEVEAFVDQLRSGTRPIAVSTARGYVGALRMFLDYVTDARYGWMNVCVERFGEAPQQVLGEWNTIAHVTEYEGRPGRRPLSYDEVQALFDAADGRTAAEPITHDTLDRQPQTQPLHYIREVLVTSGVLPARDEHLERLRPWLDRVLADKPSHHIRTVKPFAQWFVLRRARRSAARNGGYRRGSADYARARILIALELLAWLDQHALTLDALTQPVLDRWLEDGTTARRAVRSFLGWAHERGLATKLAVPMAARAAPTVLLDDDDRTAQLRRCLTDETLGLDLRVAGTLILLFALPLTRVLHLRGTDVVRDTDHTYLLVDGHRLLLPPRLADLIQQLQARAGARSTLARIDRAPGWLFPGQIATRPAHDNAVASRLQRAGIDSFAGRNGARLALAADLPASVLADLTGLHITTAMRWTSWAKRDWAQFIAARVARDSKRPIRPDGHDRL
ncbi:hypothetical protein [Dactylosporangium sp. CA-233914]|uniref:hypothetical protein n=1 Tax=Dactylosporangium sp. CA-233914 TaxID=3239934 RepID=UPI003D935944